MTPVADQSTPVETHVARGRHDAAFCLKFRGEVLSFGPKMQRDCKAKRHPGIAALLAAGLATGLILTGTAWAGEADDLQAMIDRARQGANDLERLDERGAAREDITLLRTWLDHAWGLRSEQKYDDVRDVLNRGDAQAEMIRQRIAAAKISAQAAEREAALRQVKEQIEKTRKAIQEATVQKAALEARSK